MQGEPMRNEEEATIICRCEDISLEEIRAIINRGVTDPEQIKRILRCGMGPCQGRTCSTLIAGEIARATGKPVGEIKPNTFRPLVSPVTLGVLARRESNE